jgi:MoaA/NifB/PqqE/SkfB family radical SAM enzyme
MNTKFKHRCLLPFHHLAIRPNDQVYPCCQFRHENTPSDLNLSHPDVFNHPFMEQLRTSMVNDEYVEGCSMCYKQEELSDGKRSMRLDFIRDLGTIIPIKPVLTHVDLALSNVCNNRCRMCNPELSTNWYADAKKLGNEFFPPIKSGIIRSTELLEGHDLSQLRYLKLIGGEPLMEQDKFINLLKRCNRSKLRILLTTNTTIIPNDELVTLLKECETVWVNLSIDAYGPLNDFLRKGSKWDNVTKVLDWFANTFPGKTKVHSIISIYNINNFYMLEDFINTTYPKKVKSEWQMVDGPNWMQPANLPPLVKDKILSDLKFKISDNTFSMCQAELSNNGDYELFLDKDSKLNAIRNENWKELNPDLFNLINEI